MSLFNNIFQQILGETEENIKKEKEDKSRNILKQSEENVEFDFTNYSIDLRSEFTILEEEEDDDDSYYRDKDRERELENKLKKLAEKNNKDSKKDENTTKGSKGDGGDDEFDKTSERAPDIEMKNANMEYRAKLMKEIDENNRKKGIARRKEEFRKKVEMREIKSLMEFSLAVLRRKMMIAKIRKMFKGLLTKREMNKLINGRNVNMKKLVALRRQMIVVRKKIIKQRKLQKSRAYFRIYQEEYALKKKQKKIRNKTLILGK